MNGKALLATLETIEQGETYDIFNLLPEVAGGAAWLTEIKYVAGAIREYIEESKDYDLDDLRDYGHKWADGQTETYYADINKEVQELSLWASPDIDQEVAELSGTGETVLTKLMTLYLYAGKRMTWDAVADQAFQNTEEQGE